MKHIFYLHSNICVIVAFQTIKDLVERHERVVILLNRGTQFDYFTNNVTKYDIQYITDEFRRPTSNLFSKFYNYRFQYLPRFENKAKEIIKGEEFTLYAPSYNLFALFPFFSSSYLTGYYYIEEGTMAYLSKSVLLKRYYNKLFRKGRVFSRLLGVKEFFDYKINKKFKGCICLSNHAFPWLYSKKVINTIEDYLSSLVEIPLNVDAFIVTGYLYEDIDEIYKGFDLIFNQIFSLNIKKKIVAIKFHPTAFSYERKKCEQIKDYLKDKYSEIEILFVKPSYSVESLLYRCKTELYSIFGMSSLCLYSLILGSKAFIVSKGDSIVIDEVSSVSNFLKIANS